MIQIRLDGVSKQYGSGASAVWAVQETRLDVEPGELFFLLGPSGCGKTTLLRMIAGLIPPTTGRVFFGDRNVTELAVEERNIAMVFQNYALWPHMTVLKNVEFGPRMRGVSPAERDRRVTTSLAYVQMAPFTKRKPNQLSGGQQQRVAVARALAAQPECMLLDEPLSNLDARLRLHMRGELRRLIKSSGTTAIYVTHDQKESLSMADRIAIMSDGRIVQIGTPNDLYHRPGTRFVADFLGEANFLEGRVVERSAEALRIETAGGILSAAMADTSLRQGSNVLCCVRPERISLSAEKGGASDGGLNRLVGTIGSVTFLGEIRQYTCSLSDTDAWKVTALSRQVAEFSPGQHVELCIAQEDVVAFASEVGAKS